ncbi:MAG TPA: hypothetical protein ENH11_00050 [Candidatus Acetothermia bacterium]|nr:hypothetical protein [Candidatus Acetothermia bacterium]
MHAASQPLNGRLTRFCNRRALEICAVRLSELSRRDSVNNPAVLKEVEKIVKAYVNFTYGSKDARLFDAKLIHIRKPAHLEGVIEVQYEQDSMQLYTMLPISRLKSIDTASMNEDVLLEAAQAELQRLVNQLDGIVDDVILTVQYDEADGQERQQVIFRLCKLIGVKKYSYEGIHYVAAQAPASD